MIPQAYITAWRSEAPWTSDAQVEQDLVLSRALVELFADPGLGEQLALRGGTALNKLLIRPASRYSEDIDLVQVQAAPIGPLMNVVRARLAPLLGEPRRDHSQGNTTLTYRFDSEIAPVTPLRLKIEINTREHFTVYGFQRTPFHMTSKWFTGGAEIITYSVDEILGTKLRALYQRRKGRDLFDLSLCLSRGMGDPDRIVGCFSRYMEHGGQTVSRAEFEANLSDKRADPAFLDDLKPLLTPDALYDVDEALQMVQEHLICRLPGEPWRGLDSKSTETA